MTNTEQTTAIPSFADVDLAVEVPAVPADAAAEVIGDLSAAHGYSAEQVTWSTPEQIDVTPSTPAPTGMR